MDQSVFLQNMDAETSPDFSLVMKNLMGRISGSGLSKEKKDSVIQKLKTLRQQQQFFLKNQFLYDTIKARCAGNNSGKPLLYKAGKIITLEDLPSHIKIQKPSPLTPEEVQKMKHIANEAIALKCADLRNLVYESGKLCDDDFLPLSEGEKIVTKAKQTLSEDIKAYNKTAHLYLDKTLAFWHTRDKVSEVCVSNLDWLEKRCSLLHLKLRILELRIKQAFYCEEPHQMEALKLLEEILKEKLSELKKELQKLQALTTQYNMLKGTEYDTVLHQYIGVLRKLKEQAWTLNQMSSS